MAVLFTVVVVVTFTFVGIFKGEVMTLIKSVKNTNVHGLHIVLLLPIKELL